MHLFPLSLPLPLSYPIQSIHRLIYLPTYFFLSTLPSLFTYLPMPLIRCPTSCKLETRNLQRRVCVGMFTLSLLTSFY